MTKFSKKLIKIRKENNLTQKQAGSILGVCQARVSSWEIFGARPSKSRLKKIISFGKRYGVKFEIDDF